MTVQFTCREHVAFRPMSHVRFYRAILLHECGTLPRDKVADAASVKLHGATFSHKETQILHHFFRFTILLQKLISNMSKLFHIYDTHAFVLHDSPLKLSYLHEYHNLSYWFGLFK